MTTTLAGPFCAVERPFSPHQPTKEAVEATPPAEWCYQEGKSFYIIFLIYSFPPSSVTYRPLSFQAGLSRRVRDTVCHAFPFGCGTKTMKIVDPTHPQPPTMMRDATWGTGVRGVVFLLRKSLLRRNVAKVWSLGWGWVGDGILKRGRI